jgi:hypothetical protein
VLPESPARAFRTRPCPDWTIPNRPPGAVARGLRSCATAASHGLARRCNEGTTDRAAESPAMTVIRGAAGVSRYLVCVARQTRGYTAATRAKAGDSASAPVATHLQRAATRCCWRSLSPVRRIARAPWSALASRPRCRPGTSDCRPRVGSSTTCPGSERCQGLRWGLRGVRQAATRTSTRAGRWIERVESVARPRRNFWDVLGRCRAWPAAPFERRSEACHARRGGGPAAIVGEGASGGGRLRLRSQVHWIGKRLQRRRRRAHRGSRIAPRDVGFTRKAEVWLPLR